MSLTSGARLGPYEIVSLLGKGGMGEVYKALDTRLDRQVAVKILPADLADPEARQRFEREAKAISRLSHPNICALYDVGHEQHIEYLVMELLDGETLADRLAKGPLPMADVLRYGGQIAEALAAAHRQGVAHRDLKPGNVMITRTGVKLLDFGLAKTIDDGLKPAIESETPTSTSPLTAMGTILGTYQYMAPEQLQGRPADARSDVFALGAVLYEMASGRRPFAGSTPIAVAAAVTTAEPPPIAVTPSPFERLVRACLVKDPDRRWQSAHDVALQIAAIEEDTRRPSGAAAMSGGRTRWLPWVAAAVATGAAIGFWMFRGGASPTPSEMEAQLVPPETGSFIYSPETVTIALSPDGGTLAFVAGRKGHTPSVWLRPLTAVEARPLPGTEGAGVVFWSPDGRSVAFVAGGLLKRLDLAAGAAAPVLVCAVPIGVGVSGTWGAGGQILFSASGGDAIYRVSIADGTKTAEVPLNRGVGEIRAAFPTFLPDGRHFLYVLRLQTGDQWLMLAEIGKPGRRLMPVDSNVQYVEPGLVVFAREGTLVARHFDATNGQVDGNVIAVAAAVRFFLSTGVATFTASRSGSLVYASNGDRDHLAWVDRAGHEVAVVGNPGNYLDLRIAPSGHSALATRSLPTTGTYDIWSVDLDRGIETRLTADDRSSELAPVLLQGERELIYSRTSSPAPNLMRRNLDTGREAWMAPSSGFQQATDVSPDGQWLAYSERGSGGKVTLWKLMLAGPPTPSQLQPSTANEADLRFSPDGRYRIFRSDEAGHAEVYISPVLGGRRTPVSSGGARAARWTRDSREIVYLTGDGRVVAVPVRTDPVLTLGTATTLFVLKDKPWKDFDISASGRFLAIVPDVIGDEQPLTALLNWSASVRR
jgi:dipeptidyl aminopeptidase/acylaminoacyl peptidase